MTEPKNLRVTWKGPTLDGTTTNRASMAEGKLNRIGVSFTLNGVRHDMTVEIEPPADRSLLDHELLDLARPQVDAKARDLT